MGKIKKLQDKGATILPLTVADAVLMNSRAEGTLTEHLEQLKNNIDLLLSLFGEDADGNVYVKDRADGSARGLYSNGFISAKGKDEANSTIAELQARIEELEERINALGG